MYDSKSIQSLLDNKIDDVNTENQRENGRGAFTTQFFRFIWETPVPTTTVDEIKAPQENYTLPIDQGNF